MFRHKGCITDVLAKEYWRDYQSVLREGNPRGLSFTEYVAQRVNPATITYGAATATESVPASVPWYTAECGHRHPWGLPCSVWTAMQ